MNDDKERIVKEALAKALKDDEDKKAIKAKPEKEIKELSEEAK